MSPLAEVLLAAVALAGIGGGLAVHGNLTLHVGRKPQPRKPRPGAE